MDSSVDERSALAVCHMMLCQPLRGPYSKYLLESIQTSIHFTSINLEVSTHSTVNSQLDLCSNRYHRTNLQRQSHLTFRVLEFPHYLGKFQVAA
jgi:hypothetical protein